MRVALLCDSPDEHWPSMDVVGDMLRLHLPAAINTEQVLRPIRRLTPNVTVNRILLRFVDYPRWVKQNRGRFDIFHITDHSYSQLAHYLPAARTVITCHDIDTFRSVLEPEHEPRPFLFRAMTRRILTGLQRAAHVTCDSHATRQDLLRFDVLPPERMSVVPLGVHPTCSPLPDEAADAHAAELLGNCGETVDLLHVGSTIARKGIDTLLRVFAEARAQIPQLRLLRVGGPFTADQRELVRRLGLESHVLVLPFLDRETLAAVYRRAALVLLPSGAEGFGLPVAEAMACGTPVLASDLAVLREVGGAAASYAAPGDEALWTTELLQLLAERREQPQLWRVRREKGLQQAAGFSWTNYSNRMAYVYNELLYT
jgi:glycosyltransferase involved in cell wall biosynthesis